ncbi:RDD family protein [Paenibacillus sacheonensis]|uniref:RDD family protein n=1 Tax=Paenibacillus sacheonensis TaxID=742054 RepID=A0A7X4YMV7_9BACL|nr:RDD family protein [Paenibacillus sacheonensis]MBM7564756.1 putative RDD family membrane protein YckC [Paenibacillus sacheonensis]NBC69308.1 RDD family protein [Paenibacillus sacheonensis]
MPKLGNAIHVSLGTRMIAFLWDYVIITGYIILLVGLSFLIRPWLTPLFSTDPLLAELMGFLFITLPVYLYFAICEGSEAHATWGKRKMGIVVTRKDGQPIRLGASMIRSALKFIPWELAHFTIWHMVIPTDYPDVLLNSLLAAVYGLALIYLISALFSRNKQTVYDLMAGTVVRHKE